MWACFCRSKIETIRLLLQRGAQTDTVVDGKTALAIPGRDEVVALLQAHGATAPGALGVIFM